MAATLIHQTEASKLFEVGVELFFDEVRRCPRPAIVVALPGGRSIVGFLTQLRKHPLGLTHKEWSKLHFFMVDERLVPLEHEQSNFRLVNEQALSHLVSAGSVAASQLHPFVLNPSSSDHGLSVYDAELKKFGGRIDIAFLGVGEDAHVAALFPNHHSVKNNSALFISMPDSPKPPPARMTASRALISGADAVFAIFTGEGKRDAFRGYLSSSGDVVSCPAKIIDQVKRGYALTDLVTA